MNIGAQVAPPAPASEQGISAAVHFQVELPLPLSPLSSGLFALGFVTSMRLISFSYKFCIALVVPDFDASSALNDIAFS